MSEDKFFKVDENPQKLSEVVLENIRNEFSGIMPEMESDLKLILSLADMYDTRLLAGTCVICSNAETAQSQSYTHKELAWGNDYNLKLIQSPIDIAWGSVYAQHQLELCHRDIDFFPVFEKCNVCGKCEPEIENNEWQGYDTDYQVGDGYGLSKNKAYMICTKGGGYIYPTDDGQKNIMYEYAVWSNENITEETKAVTTISKEYFNFLVKYEGLGDTWKYAEKLSDGTVTIAYGVVIKDQYGNYPLEKDVYDYYISKKNQGIPLTEEEAVLLTETRLNEKINKVIETAEKNNWNLSQNQFDALVDMVWNMNPRAIEFNASILIATGDLSDSSVKHQLEKEILETATFEENGIRVWSKNLVERRLDIVRIAEGGEKAYTKNEFSAQWWNQNGIDFLIQSGISEDVVDQYPIQYVKEY